MELTADTVFLGLIWFLVFLFSTTLHEAAHAFAAFRLGDPTAYHGGQVTLNPWPHVRREPFGMVLVPLISFGISGWMFGWASAPYDPEWAARYPKRAGWMAAAGPLANLLLVLVAGLAIKAGVVLGVFLPPEQLSFAAMTTSVASGTLETAATLLSVLFSLNLILFVFNLLPFPPLDGSAVLQLLLPDELGRRYTAFLRQPMLGLVGILIAWQIFGPIFAPVLDLALGILYPGVQYR